MSITLVRSLLMDRFDREFNTYIFVNFNWAEVTASFYNAISLIDL